MTGEVFAVFINWLLLHVAGLVSMVLVFNRCFPLRHSYTVWLIYFALRGVLRAYLWAVMAAGDMSPGLFTFDVIFVFITAVANYAVLWYTWNGDALKIGIAGIVSDLLAGAAMVICISAVNVAAGNRFTPEMATLSIAQTLAASVALVLMVLLMLKIMDPAIRWFRNAEFHHREILVALVILSAALFSSTNLTDTAGFNSSAFIVCITGALLLAPMLTYMIKTVEIQQNKRVLLRQQAEMSSAYILAVDSQSETIASHRELLDSVAAQIDSSDSRLTNDELRKYITELKKQADSLRSGSYSSNIAIDAVLTAYAGRFEALGYKVDFRADAADEDSGRVADVSRVLLNWAESAASASQIEQKNDVGSLAETIKYRVARRGNQLIFDLNVTGSGKGAFPVRQLRGHISRSDVVSRKRVGGTYEIRLMMEAAE